MQLHTTSTKTVSVKKENHAYGPMIIERINPYKYNSDFRKVCLQLSRSETSKHVISAWKRDLFGGSSARSTIKYDSIKPTTMRMLKGERVYNNISANIPCHAFNIYFWEGTFQSPQEGIHLISSGVLCQCERLIQ